MAEILDAKTILAITEGRYPTKMFALLLEGIYHEVCKLVDLKGGEYSGDDDRLANFRRNAERLGLDYRQVWAVYAGKHWDALMQYVKDVGTNTTRIRTEPLRGRAIDLIVYLTLLIAMLEEKEVTANRE